MGLVDNVLGWFRKPMPQTPEEKRVSILTGLYDRWSQIFFSGLFNGSNFEKLISDGYQLNSDVYGVTSWIASEAVDIPWNVEVKRGEEWEHDPSHPLQKLISQPNEFTTAKEFWKTVYLYKLITGNAFLYAPRLEDGVNTGQTLELFLMPVQDVDILSGGYLSPVLGYELRESDNSSHIYRPEDVLHVKEPNLRSIQDPARYFGQSPLLAALLPLERSNKNDVAATTTFDNVGAAGIISEDGDEFAGSYTEEQQGRIEELWKENYNGYDKVGSMYFTNQKVTFHRINLSPVDMALIADKLATKRDICTVYHVASTIFNDNENSTYNNVQEAIKRAYDDAVLPLVNYFIDAFSGWLIDSYGGAKNVRIVPDISNIRALQDDLNTKVTWLSKMKNDRALTVNEYREQMGLPVLDDPKYDEIQDPFDFSFGMAEEELKNMGVPHYLEK